MRVGLNPPRNTVVGAALVLLSAFAFGITPAMVRLAYGAQLNEMSLVTFRCLIAAATVWAWSRAFHEPDVPWHGRLRLMALGGGLFGPQMWLYFASLHHLDTSIAVAVVYVYPAVVAAMVAVRVRRLPRAGEMGLLGLALGGIAVITLLDGNSSSSAFGLFLAGSTAVAYAAYVVVADSLVNRLPPLGASCWVLVGAGGSSLIVAVAT